MPTDDGHGSDHSRRTRGTGRDRIINAAQMLLAQPRLVDLLGYVSQRNVAMVADVSLGTVSHHWKSSEELIRDVCWLTLDPDNTPVTERTLAGIDEAIRQIDGGAEGSEVLEGLLRIAASDLIGYGDEIGTAPDVITFVATAAAPNDESARALLAHLYDGLGARYEAAYERLLKAWKRQPTKDVDLHAIAVSITALADGFLIRSRFTDETNLDEVFARAALTLAAGMTEPLVPEPGYEPLLDQLVRDSQLDPHKRDAIEAAAVEIFNVGTWSAVTVQSVAERAGVTTRTVRSHFGDRDGLAAAIWSRFVPDLASDLKKDAGLGVRAQVHRHLQRLADRAHEHSELTAALLQRVLDYTAQHGPPTYEDPADPRTIVPLPQILAPVLKRKRRELRRGVADTDLEALDIAAFLTNSLLLRATTRPRQLPIDVADFVMNISFDGITKGA